MRQTPDDAAKRPPTSTVRILVLRVIPFLFAAVLLTSTAGGVGTQLDLPYRAAAVAAAGLYLVAAAAPWMLLLRLIAVSLSGLAWLGRMAWFVVVDIQAFAWTSTYAATVLLTLVCSAVMWSMTADWLVMRGTDE